MHYLKLFESWPEKAGGIDAETSVAVRKKNCGIRSRDLMSRGGSSHLIGIPPLIGVYIRVLIKTDHIPWPRVKTCMDSRQHNTDLSNTGFPLSQHFSDFF